jgi:uncharacterized protein YlbG (UPF0298 family)
MATPKDKLKEKIKRNHKARCRQKLEDKEKKSKVALYSGKKKPPLYKFPETLNTDSMFWVPKSIILDFHWARLSASARSVLPVIASLCNKNDKAWPSDVTIGILCGRSHVVVNKGTSNVANEWPEWFKKDKNIKGKKNYEVKLIEEKNNSGFPFYSYVIFSGVWSKLKPVAQSLYLVMRCLAYWNLDIYERLENENYDLDPDFDPDQLYKERKYDLFPNINYTKKQLAKYAGINENSINKALQELENNWLIKTVDGGWLIYLKTKNLQCHSSKELNAKAEKSFGYVTKSKETQEVGNSH